MRRIGPGARKKRRNRKKVIMMQESVIALFLVIVCAAAAGHIVADPHDITAADGGARLLVHRQQDAPHGIHLGPNDVLVRVFCAGVNRLDLLRRDGVAQGAMGLEVSGQVVRLGSNVTTTTIVTTDNNNNNNKVNQHGVRLGDRVFGFTRAHSSAYNSYTVCDAREIAAIPRGVRPCHAAGYAEAFGTAYQALHWVARVHRSRPRVVVVHAAASSIGTSVIQLLTASRSSSSSGSRNGDGDDGVAPSIPDVILATVGSDEKVALVESLHDNVIGVNRHNCSSGDQDWSDHLGPLQADLVIDVVGGAYMEQNLRVLATDGTLVLLGTLGGASWPGEFPIRHIIRQHLSILGSALSNRSPEYKQQLLKEMAEHIEANSIKLVIDNVWNNGPIEQRVADAHTRMRQNGNLGKMIIQVKK